MCLITFFSLLGAKKDPNSNKFDQFRKLVLKNLDKSARKRAQKPRKRAQNPANGRKLEFLPVVIFDGWYLYAWNNLNLHCPEPILVQS